MGAKNELKLRKKRVLSRKAAKQFRKQAMKVFGEVNAKTIGIGEAGDGSKVYLLDGEAVYAQTQHLIYPTLNNPHIEQLPSVIVDMGAIPYVCKGADIMSPGVVRIEGNFKEGDLVVIRDINHGKALAIASTLISSDDFEGMKKGKAFKNLHYVGDKIWGAI